MAVPVLPFPELQCTAMTLSGSSISSSIGGIITLEKLVHSFDHGEQHCQCGCMMILPVKVGHLTIERRLIILALAAVEHPVLSAMVLLEEANDLIYRVPVRLFEDSTAWVRHGYHPRCDVGYVEVILQVLVSPALPADQLP